MRAEQTPRAYCRRIAPSRMCRAGPRQSKFAEDASCGGWRPRQDAPSSAASRRATNGGGGARRTVREGGARRRGA
eukprot:4979365-Prymnesium_polylepis.1